jgi:hypothetical protein
MALQLGYLRDALVSAGADEEKARKAADELAGYDRELADVRSDLKVLKWMAGSNLALTLGVLFRLLSH